MVTTNNHATQEELRKLAIYVVDNLPTREHLNELRAETQEQFDQVNQTLQEILNRLGQHENVFQEILKRLPENDAA